MRARVSQWRTGRADAAGLAHSAPTGSERADGTVEPPADPVHLLLQRSGQGDSAAFGELYDLMSVPIYALILARLAPGPEAERLLLEVFLGLWQRCPLYPECGQTALGWVLAYARQAVDFGELTLLYDR